MNDSQNQKNCRYYLVSNDFHAVSAPQSLRIKVNPSKGAVSLAKASPKNQRHVTMRVDDTHYK